MKKVQPKDQLKNVVSQQVEQQEKDRQELQVFWNEYQELCKKYNAQVIVTPSYKARDDGTWSLVLQSSVGKSPKIDSR